MSGYRHMYTLAAMCQRTGLQDAQVWEFIDLGLLLPESYSDEYLQTLKKIGLEKAEWSDAEIMRYEEIARQMSRAMHPFYQQILSSINVYFSRFDERCLRIENQNNKMQGLLYELKRDVFKHETLVDLHYFCEITGYKYQTCLNNVIYLDKSKLAMHLDFEFYKGLTWYKTGRKWQTPLSELLECRSGFRYEAYLDERKRKGERVQRKRSLDDLDF